MNKFVSNSICFTMCVCVKLLFVHCMPFLGDFSSDMVCTTILASNENLANTVLKGIILPKFSLRENYLVT